MILRMQIRKPTEINQIERIFLNLRSSLVSRRVLVPTLKNVGQ